MAIDKQQNGAEDFPNQDIDSLMASLESGVTEAGPKFALEKSLFHFHKKAATDWQKRKGVKKHILPVNAAEILDYLPSETDDRTHCTLKGNFIICDLIPHVIGMRGNCPHLRISTLGMSVGNAQLLAGLMDSGKVGKLSIIVSLYFQRVDKDTTYSKVMTILEGKARVTVARSHAKVILIPTDNGDFYVFEGSSNLRSSDNIEQLLIVNDRETHDHHCKWMAELESND